MANELVLINNESKTQQIFKTGLTQEERELAYRKIDEAENISFIEREIHLNDNDIDPRCGLDEVLDYKNNLYAITTHKDKFKITLISPFVFKLKDIQVEVSNKNFGVRSRRTYIFDFITSSNPSSPLSINFSGEELPNMQSFKRKLSSVSPDLIFHAKERHYIEIISKIQETSNAIEIMKFIELGYNKEFNFWVWTNAILDLNTNTIGYRNPDTGKITFQDGRNFLVEVKEFTSTLQCFNAQLALQESQKFFDNFFEWVDKPEIILAFGTVLAVVYVDLFWKNTEGFPFVLWHGGSGVGKSTLQKCLGDFFGITDLKMSGTSTAFVVRECLSKLYNIPVFVEEAEQKQLDDLGIINKDAYARVSRSKGRKDGSVKSTEVNTVMSISSNEFFSKPTPQIINRCIIANMPQKSKNLSKFKYFEASDRENLSMILPILVGARKHIMPLYFTNLSLINSIEGSHERHHSNIAIALSVWDIIFKIAGQNYFDKTDIVKRYLEFYKPYLNMSLSFGDYIMNTLGNYILRKLVDYRNVYVLTKETMVRLNLTKFLSQYNNINPKAPMSKEYLRTRLASDARFRLDESPLKDVGRAIFIDISKNDELLELINQHRGNNG